MDRRRFLTLAAVAGLAPAAGRAQPQGAHAFRFDSIDGGKVALADWAGRPILVVNTASRCAFTPQYDALQALWDGRRDRGLVVLGAPSRDFGRQEYEDEGAIKDFCEVNFAIDFPMTRLVKVKGPDAHPFYAWAREAGRTQDLPAPRWNFHKYLVAPDGSLAGAWGSSTPPDHPEILAAIDALLPAG
jgi:glutathione peroxidase